MALSQEERSRRWKEKNPDGAKLASRNYRERNLEARRADTRDRMRRARIQTPEKVKAANAAYRQRHPDRVNAAERRRYLRDPTKKLARLAEYKAAHPAEYYARIARWQKANPAKRRAIENKRKHRFRTPAWADHAKIAEFYELARWLTVSTGTPHEVDHIIPLNGRTVSGLHVETNMQILTRADNRRKSNKAPA